MTKHKFKIDDKVHHFDDNKLTGKITGLTTLGEVSDGSCEPEDENDPWYNVIWNNDEDGNESEESLKLIKK